MQWIVLQRLWIKKKNNFKQYVNDIKKEKFKSLSYKKSKIKRLKLNGLVSHSTIVSKKNFVDAKK